MAGDRLLPESLACAGPGTVECCKSAVVFATIEALFLSQPSSTSPPTALVSGVGPATLSGNASLGDLPISGCLSSRLWSAGPFHRQATITRRSTATDGDGLSEVDGYRATLAVARYPSTSFYATIASTATATSSWRGRTHGMGTALTSQEGKA